MAGYLWLVLGVLSFVAAVLILNDTGNDYIIDIFPLMNNEGFNMTIVTALLFVNYFIFIYIYVVYRRVPEWPVGRFAKAAIEVIVVCAAAILRASFEHNIFHLIILVLVTLYLHALRQLMHVASDIGFVDVVLGALMQVVAYEIANVIVSGALIILYGGGIIYSYRYQSYSTSCNPTTDFTKKQGDVAC